MTTTKQLPGPTHAELEFERFGEALGKLSKFEPTWLHRVQKGLTRTMRIDAEGSRGDAIALLVMSLDAALKADTQSERSSTPARAEGSDSSESSAASTSDSTSRRSVQSGSRSTSQRKKSNSRRVMPDTSAAGGKPLRKKARR